MRISDQKKVGNIMVKELLKRGFIGIGIASLVCSLVSVITYLCGVDFSSYGIMNFVLNQLGYSLIGFVTACASLLFEVKNFSRLKATILHFFAILTSYALAGFAAGWFKAWGVSLLIPAACFLGSYVITWFAVYFSVKRSVALINKKLSEK